MARENSTAQRTEAFHYIPRAQAYLFAIEPTAPSAELQEFIGVALANATHVLQELLNNATDEEVAGKVSALKFQVDAAFAAHSELEGRGLRSRAEAQS